MWKNLFGKKQSKLYTIEVSDAQLDQQVAKLLKQIKEQLLYFQSHIDEETLQVKEEFFMQLRKSFLECLQDIDILKRDIRQIQNTETQHQKNLIINDGQFLEDKQNQLQILYNNIRELNQVLEQRPSRSDLKSELITKIQTALQINLQTIAHILSDDEHLQLIYQSLNEL